MEKKYLIDTSVVIKYLNEAFSEEGITFLDKVLDDGSIISFITEIELQVWDPPDPTDMKIYQSFVLQSEIIGIDKKIIENTIQIRKLAKLKLPDALIAATAIVNDFTLIADNDKDFARVSELKYLNPNKNKIDK